MTGRHIPQVPRTEPPSLAFAADTFARRIMGPYVPEGSAMPKNHARANDVKLLRDSVLPVQIKHTEALLILGDERRDAICSVITYFEGAVTTHADAVYTLDNDPRFQALCTTCGWSLAMVCPECSLGCGCSRECTGWRHGEFMQDDDPYDGMDPDDGEDPYDGEDPDDGYNY